MTVILKRMGGLWLFLLSAILITLPALADWNEGEPFKWVQYPDLSPMGMDIFSCDPYILADDFLCTETGPVTGIHIWGSWLYDYLPANNPENVTFILSLHKDIPAEQNPYGYFSMPGEVEWWRVFQPGEFTARVWADGLMEGFMYPPEQYWGPGADTVCWQYNFRIPEAEAFIQQGTETDPVVYWLDVQAIVSDPEAWFGWKTSPEHWNDKAVFTMGTEPYSGPWQELFYPPGHELYMQPIDLAFVIQGAPLVEELDFGDAPDSYQTTLAMDGARHAAQAGYCMGTLIDTEPDGQPSVDAKGDDNNNLADEDGVIAGTDLIPGGTCTVAIRASAAGYLDGWIDWAGDGSFAESGDRLWAVSQPLTAGVNTLSFAVPATAVAGTQTFARLRFSSTGGLSWFGYAPDGEVEDYDVYVGQHDEWKWSQWPDLGDTGIDVCATYPHVLADDFLCEATGPVTSIQIWGSWLNDVLPPSGDPGAVTFTLSFHEDIPAEESPTGYSMPGEVLWLMDFQPGSYDVEIYADGLQEGWMWPPDDWIWPGDTICWQYKFHVPPSQWFYQQGTPDDPRVYWLDVQCHPETDMEMFGWKTSIDHWNDDAVWGEGFEPYYGPWFELFYPPGHEWEGHSIDLAFRLEGNVVEPTYDFGDAPDPSYPTLLASDGARHRVPQNYSLWLGQGLDTEPDGQPDPAALGDDMVGWDDEDGVTFDTWLSPGGTAEVTAIVSDVGYLDGWIDFDGDGSWAEPYDHVLVAEWIPGVGSYTFTFDVPETGLPAHETYARFRVQSTNAALPCFGEADDGEVEDYLVLIEADASASESPLPERLGLMQNLPNPFNPWTKIAFEVPRGGADVRLEIFSADGRRVAVLLDEFRDAGQHSAIWRGEDDQGRRLSSGVYYYRLSADDFRETRKMLMLR